MGPQNSDIREWRSGQRRQLSHAQALKEDGETGGRALGQRQGLGAKGPGLLPKEPLQSKLARCAHQALGVWGQSPGASQKYRR